MEVNLLWLSTEEEMRDEKPKIEKCSEGATKVEDPRHDGVFVHVWHVPMPMPLHVPWTW